ncbi:MAG: histone deacetylase [Flavobacteriales bacterium]|nr:histone deacetylase [Flavobacteriales bacterium]
MLKIAWRKEYVQALPEGHRFPMEKYALLPQQLLYEGTISEENLFAPEPIDDEILLWTHDAGYVQKLKGLQLDKNEIRRMGFPLDEHLILREWMIMEGTRKAAEYALELGIAMNIAGGTHHAYTNRGEGFCLLNDNAIAANWLLKKKNIERILIVDLDVHQGNGTAEIFANEKRVFTLSVHGEKNYPLHKEQSDLDIGLPDKIEDEAYLQIIRATLPSLVEKFKPQFIFYQCGVDILSTDKLGRLGVSIEACKERDRIVLELARRENIPIVCSMGGGYSERIADIVEAHANTYRLAQQLFF